MRLCWRKTLLCICALAGLAHSGVVSTPDTMVVAKSDDSIQEQSTTATPQEAIVTTEEPNLPVKLSEMEVKSEVSSRYAHTAVVTRVRNPAKKAQEATFRVLLPETAFISGFTMILDGTPYKAYVKEKEEAKQIYSDAVSHGIGAAHVAAKARDSNHFTVSVNVEANTTAVFNLTYEELLTRRNGVYNHAINLHPGTLVPRLTVTIHIKEPNKIKILRIPEIRTGNEIDATEKDTQNSKAVVLKSNDDHEATITFTPDLEEQKLLAQIYADKTKDSRYNRQRWSQNAEETSDGVLGQFVVQYDVERPANGEILVNDGYFVHFFAPSSLTPLNKHVVFVLDTSGSMLGRKIEQLREAMQTILSELKQGDYFNIVEFASSVKVHDLNEANNENVEKISPWIYTPKATALVPPAQATPENIEKAKVIIRRLDGGGATAISTALKIAIDLVQKGIGWTPEIDSNSTNETPGADKKDTAADETLNVEEEKTHADKTNETPVANKDEVELEPIIIFLTDGEPTTGEIDPKRIINQVTERNYGKKKATIFSLAFGEGADRDFLRKLSLRSDGFMRHIYEASDAALQLHDFYRQVSSPLLSDVKFTYPQDQVTENSVTRYKFRTFYDGSEVVVAGRVAASSTELTPRVSGFCGVIDRPGRRPYEISPRVPIAQKKDTYFPLERLWAYLTIKQLLDERDAAEENDKPDKANGPEKKALNLALKYEFVTPLTSLVVVKPNATKAVDAESVDKQNDLTRLGAYSGGIQVSALHGPSLLVTNMASQSLDNRFSLSSVPNPVPLLDMDEETDFQSSYAEGFDSPGIPGVQHAAAAAPAGFFGYYQSTQVTTTVTPPLPPTTGNPLEVYHLQEYSWVNNILNTTSDTLSLYINGTTITLKLSKDVVAPKNTDGDEECANELNGASGVLGSCVYLTRCEAAKSIPAQVYRYAHCSVNGYAGVCCPKDKVDKFATTSQQS